MGIIKVGDQENLILDVTPQSSQPRLRKLAQNEDITLDKDRAILDPRHTSPIYYPQQQQDTSIVGHVKSGATDATRRMYALSANVLDMAADKADSIEMSAKMKYYDVFGEPTFDPNAPDTISAPQGNIVSRALRARADKDFEAERILKGRMNEMNVQDTVSFDDVKADPLSLKTGRFILEQGARSLPEMATAMVPIVGLPTVLATTTQNVLEERLANTGRDPTSIPTGDDMSTALAFAAPSAALERLGAVGDLAKPLGGIGKSLTKVSQVPGAALRSGAGEAGTEFVQENLELAGATVGTGVDVTLQDRIDTGLQGAIIGGPMGSSVRAGTEGLNLAIQQATPAEEIEQGYTEQNLGGDVQPEQELPELTKTVMPDRDDLASSINDNTPLKEVTESPVEIAPILQERGIVLGATVEQISEFGEISQGKIVSAEETETPDDSDNELEITIIDQDGQLRTLFSTDGEIGIVVPEQAPVAPPVGQEEVIAPVIPEQDFQPAPPPISNFQLDDVQEPIQPQAPAEDQQRSVEQLTNSLQVINDQGKRGWNKMLTDNKKKVIAELNDRFPEWDIPTRVDVESAAVEVDTNPTDGQKESGNYKKGHVSIQGLPITLENPKGSTRSGKDADGTAWSVEMPAHYGYIKRTEGADGDNVDVYIGDNPSSDNIFIVDQIDNQTKNFDEHKVFIGYENVDQVKIAYNSAFSDGLASQRYGGVTQMSVAGFKDWLKNSNNKKPIAYKKPPPKELIMGDKNIGNKMLGEEAYNSLTDDQKSDVILIGNRLRNTVDQGKADIVAARVLEGFSIAEDVLSYGNKEIADSLKGYALSISKRYGKAIYDHFSKPVQSSKIKADEKRLAKKIKEAHTYMDEQDAKAKAKKNKETVDPTPERAPTEQVSTPEQNDAPSDDVATSTTNEQETQGDEADAGEVLALKSKENEINYESSGEPGEGGYRKRYEPKLSVTDKQIEDAIRKAKPWTYLDDLKEDVAKQLGLPKNYNFGTKVYSINQLLGPKIIKEDGWIAPTQELLKKYEGQKVEVLRGVGSLLGEKIEIATIKSNGKGGYLALPPRARTHGYIPQYIREIESNNQEKIDSSVSNETNDLTDVTDTNVADIKPTDQNVVKKLDNLDKDGQTDQKDVKTTETKASDNNAQKTDGQEKISDFGEKISGAKKDLWSLYSSSLSDALPDDISKITLSKSYPEPNYEKLIEAGVDIKVLAAIKSMRDEIPAKPRVGYKLKQWVGKVTLLRDFASKLLDGTRDVDYVLDKMRDGQYNLSQFADRIELYADLGYPAFTKAKGWKIRAMNGVMENGKRLEGIQHYVSEGSSWGTRVDSYEDGVKLLREKLEDLKANPKAKVTKLVIYQVRATKEILIGKKINARKYIDLKGKFTDWKVAREYLNNNRDELEQLLKDKKDIPSERREINDTRVGEDYRGGKDISPDEFTKKFGFRGVQFGNYVEQKKREENLNDTYDSMIDMARILGIPDEAISLNGTLGLAFGARGSGGKNPAKAHYERGQIVINLTKKNGAGSLGHEWFHAMDHNFGVRRTGSDYLTENPTFFKQIDDDGNQVIREEVVNAFSDLMKAVNKTEIKERSKGLDVTRAKDYWSTNIEMAARSFEAYLIHKAKQKGQTNDFLANITSQESWDIGSSKNDVQNTYPYPTDKEMEDTVAPAFDNLFKVIKTKKTDEGTAMFSRKADGLQSSLLKSANALKQDKAIGGQYLAMLRKSDGVKEEEISWIGLDDFLMGKNKISKQEVVDYINDNQVHIEEVTLNTTQEADDSINEEAYNEINERISRSGNSDKRTEEYLENWNEEPTQENWSILRDRLEGFGISADDIVSFKDDDKTKYSQYTLPEGENYREVLLTLPNQGDYGRNQGKVDVLNNERKILSKKIIGENLPDGKTVGERVDEIDQEIESLKADDPFKSGHFDQENILAHVRLNDRTDADGNKVLFIEEIQSDWHQSGRKQGYKNADTTAKAIDKRKREIQARINSYKPNLVIVDQEDGVWYAEFIDGKTISTISKERRPDIKTEAQAREALSEHIESEIKVQTKNAEMQLSLVERDGVEVKGVPDAPFKNNWHEMAFRRVAQMAAQEGYDSIAWTPGEVQNDRFDLSKQIGKVEYFMDSKSQTLLAYDLSGKRVMNEIMVSPEKVGDYVGKDVAKRLIDANPDEHGMKSLEGLDLKVGGEGMKGFYDKILKNYADKFGKKFGSKVGVTDINQSKNTYKIQNIKEIEPNNPYSQATPYAIVDKSGKTHGLFPTKEKAMVEIAKLPQSTEVWTLPITDKMRGVANEGFALFKKNKKASKRKRTITDKIDEQINDKLKKSGFERANFRFFSDPQRTGLEGIDDNVEGAYHKGNIFISVYAEDPLSTLDHEIIHALKAAGAFTESEWALLESKAEGWRKKYGIDKTYKKQKLSEAKLNEEAIARAIQDHRIQGKVRRIANRLLKFLKNIKATLNGADLYTAQDVFDAVMTGDITKQRAFNIASSESFPMFSLSKSPKSALNQANESLANVRGLENKLVKDMGRVSSRILHPQQIAVLYKEFTGVYTAVIKRFKDREVLMNDLATKLNLYNNLKGDAKDRVNATLEIGRLDGVSYKPDAKGNITVENSGHENAIYIKDGEEITLTPTESNAYLKVRNMFDLAFDKFSDSVLEDYGLLGNGVKTIQDVEKLRLKAVKNGDTAEVRRFKEILTRLNDVASAKKRGYIPLKRWGKVGISVKDKDGTVIHFERIELSKKSNKKDRIGDTKEVQSAIERLGEKYDSKDYDINSFEMSNFDESVAFIDLNEFDILTASSELSVEERKKTRDVIEKKMKEKGFRSHFFRSKDVPGYNDDFERAFNEYAVSISSYIARRMNESAIDAEVTSITTSGKKELHNYALNYLEYINDTVEEFGFIRMTNFYLFLGLNVSSGMVNLTQPFLVTAPWLKQKFSHALIAKTMTKSYAEMYKFVKPNKAGMGVFDFSTAPLDVRDALIQAQKSGDFLSQATHDAMGISNSTNKALRGWDKVKRKIAEGAAITFSVPEKMNRIVTFTVAYRLAMLPESRKKIERFIKNNHLARELLKEDATAEDYAFAYAELAVVSTQYRVGKLNRPQIARSYGSVILQFMSFTAQTFEAVYNIGKVQGGHNKVALASMLFAVWAFAGIKGIPFEEDMEDIIEWVYKMITKTDLDIDAEMRTFLTDKFGKVAAEAILKGLPAALLNMDMSQRLGFGKMIPDDASDALGVSGELIRKPLRAIDALGRGEPLVALAEIAPSGLANPIKAYNWTKDGVRTRRGDKVIDNDDVTAVDVGLKAIGITTSRISRKRDGIYSEKRLDGAAKDLRNSYYSRIAKTIVERERLKKEGLIEESEQMQLQLDNIFGEIQAHNDKSPLHKKIKIQKYTVKMKVFQEMKGAEARKGRKQSRPRKQELKEIYNW